MSTDRTLINLRGYCFYCLKQIVDEGSSGQCAQSPACTPIPPSPLSTPLRLRCHYVHDLPVDQRLAPLSDLCSYLGVDLPDCYAFGDGSDPEVLYPPLCDKCHDLSARLCVLQDELQYIQTKISNTVARIHRRVASVCDKRGQLRREEFNKEFRRKSKGSLSRGRGEQKDPEKSKVTELLKTFQSKIVVKDHENREKRKRRASKVLFPEYRPSLGPALLEPAFMVSPMVREDDEDEDRDEQQHVYNCSIKIENKENVEPPPQYEKHNESLSSPKRSEFLPLEETLRCAKPRTDNDDGNEQQFEVECLPIRRVDQKPYPDVSTILYCPSSLQIEDDSKIRNDSEFDGTDNMEQHEHEDEVTQFDDFHMKTTLRITTRSQTKMNLGTVKQNSQNDNFVIRPRAKKISRLRFRNM